MNLTAFLIQSCYLLVLFVLLGSCEKEISTTPPEEPPPQGFIFVNSNPPNYKIYLDGRFTGRFTPDTLPYVTETKHQIELKRKYWLDSSVVTSAEGSVVKSVFIDFMKSRNSLGELKLFSQPEGATIEINDSLTDLKTPYLLKGLIPGIYSIEYHLPQHRSIKTRIAVESNKVKSISLALQDTSIWVDYTKENSNLPNNNIVALAVDEANRIWAGTINSGIVTIKGNQWQYINRSNSSLPTDSIRVIKINNNTVWIGTFKGLVVYKNNSVQRIIDKSNSPMFVDRVNAIEFGEDNSVFVGSNSGMLKIAPDGSMRLYPSADEKADRNVSDIAVEKSENKVWVSIKGKIGDYNNRLDRIEYISQDDPFFEVVTQYYLSKLELMFRPTDKKIWALFSSTGGITSLPPMIADWDGEEWSYEYLANENLIFYDAITDNDNYVWIASSMGLGKFENLQTGYFYKVIKTGLFSDKLLSVVEDKRGILWIGSEDGLFKYKKNLIP